MTNRPGAYTLEVYLDDNLLSLDHFYVADPGTQYDPTQDYYPAYLEFTGCDTNLNKI